MKVVHVEGGRHLYGGALQVVFLLRGLKERGVECVLVCPPDAAVGRAAAAYARVRELPLGGDADIGQRARLARVLREERPALVHLHSRRGVDLWGALAARAAGVPAVLSRRVDNPEPGWWARWKYGLVDRVVTISEGIRRVLRDEGVPAQQVVCVPSAVDTTLYRPRERGTASDAAERAWFENSFGLQPGMQTIAMAAQFIERKGHATLLRALQPLLAARPPGSLRVLLFGKGPLVEPLRAQAAQFGLADQVGFEGFRDDLPRVLPHIDVLAHPAQMEGLGVALLQAAACAVPIVAGRAGGIPEIVRPGLNGELIEPDDDAALARHLITLLGDDMLRARYGAAGRELVLREFSVDAMVDGNLRVYREVLARR